jgi:hypothetical protein
MPWVGHATDESIKLSAQLIVASGQFSTGAYHRRGLPWQSQILPQTRQNHDNTMFLMDNWGKSTKKDIARKRLLLEDSLITTDVFVMVSHRDPPVVIS